MNPADFIHLADEAAAKADRRIRDDVRSDCIIAMYELAGVDDYEMVVRAAIKRVVNRHSDELRKMPISLSVDVTDYRGGEPPTDRILTKSRKDKLERDMVIRAAVEMGVPQRVVARVLGVGRDLIRIVAKRN